MNLIERQGTEVETSARGTQGGSSRKEVFKLKIV